MSAFISRDQGRAHAMITEFIESALNLNSFSTTDSRKFLLIDSGIFIQTAT